MTWGFTILAGLSLTIWLYLIILRGGFWRANQRLEPVLQQPDAWPSVIALVPARDEAEVVGHAVGSLLQQDYPGPFQVVLCDDHSTDRTGQTARDAAQAIDQSQRLTVVTARPLPAGWSGKLWALNEALVRAESLAPDAAYLWLSDADIAHGPDTLRHLVAKAEAERHDLVSLMVMLSCRGFWERLLIPPFIYFFQMLYPFSWVNNRARGTAAAAGGCILLRHGALTRAGGFEAIRGALIDDCTLARQIKDLPPGGTPEETISGTGGLWLGLGTESRSLRPYRGLGDIWRMVARSAYTQLRHSPLLLFGTLLGLSLTFLMPPLLGLSAQVHGDDVAAIMGFATWSLMAVTALPTYKLYRQPIWLAAFLPLAAAFYGVMTLDSAARHWCGRGGTWKGRIEAKRRKVASARPER